MAGLPSRCHAWRLVAWRGRLRQGPPGGGAMTAVEAAEAGGLPLRAGRPDVGGVAGGRGRGGRVVAGGAGAVEGVGAQRAARGWGTERLRVSRAFHSPRMDGVLDEFR
ncbi:hypothetical protein VM98_37450, partial [Streptomyces rubellomurinus subsp. indigoferus]